MSLLGLLKGKGPSGFGYASTALEVTEGCDLSGQTMLVTGTSSGLGQETVRVLAARGARVLATARSEQKAREATRAYGPNIVPVALELADPASVRAAVAAVKQAADKLDAIICNAGVMALPRLEQVHGYERQFFTNHIGHFILVTGLLERLSSRGRVVMLSSDAHHWAPKAGIEFDNLSGAKHYNTWRAYGQSKLANLLFARELGKRLVGTGKTANAVHPGVIQTELQRSMPLVQRAVMSVASPIAFKSVAQGAATQCFVATHPSLGQVTSEYFSDCNVAPSSRRGRNPQLAAQLWEESERIAARV